MTRVSFALVLLAALVSVAAAQQPKTPPKKADKKAELVLSKEEQGVIDLTNAERKKADLPPLKANPKLMAAARGHGENMAKQDKLDHVLDDKKPADRVKDAGYKYAAVGENVAWNQKDPAQVVEAWMNSEGHRANILKKEYEEIGVAVAKNAKGEPYWVQVFGKQLGR
ncbi:SCP-like extracellular OS=Actinosynnema mirum (strain ATCC 29888 / DSM 43827 / NBRC 14064 / IMRU 3971) GN=Amir_4392 PE=4 SV=1: CAP [Gemmataceae bacterium]|nr:SCP-like extracellular OS=Actinosynnema mirum (strain ATCC 29888 / DSM 43827 / NBRC 14064 / IMRU 3971) GN=Amir_4392 PE=4 SV=1: CAP [Gemmataceae bacterium]VTT98481.1 SCP-like extracellular OS=Actinosynnema mirum (strain ATCC 29888 / DSM 43827 / NBRC 14064 / IMRU 3971) GN=Amir_4392 PE=4 SV=1: CAP [Gemmataceae bacterium]